jgi:hypothetical protein
MKNYFGQDLTYIFFIKIYKILQIDGYDIDIEYIIKFSMKIF